MRVMAAEGSSSHHAASRHHHHRGSVDGHAHFAHSRFPGLGHCSGHSGLRHSHQAGIHDSAPSARHSIGHIVHAHRPKPKADCFATACEKDATGPALGSKPALSELLEVFSKLLEMHEVKLTLQLVHELSSTAAASSALAISGEELAKVFRRFSGRIRRDAGIGGDGLAELESYNSPAPVEHKSSLRRDPAKAEKKEQRRKTAHFAAPAFDATTRSSAGQGQGAGGDAQRQEDGIDSPADSVGLQAEATEVVPGMEPPEAPEEPCPGTVPLPDAMPPDMAMPPNMVVDGDADSSSALRSAFCRKATVPFHADAGATKAAENHTAGFSSLCCEEPGHTANDSFVSADTVDDDSGKPTLAHGKSDEAKSASRQIHRRATVTKKLLELRTSLASSMNGMAAHDLIHEATGDFSLEMRLRDGDVDLVDEIWLSMPSNKLIIHPNGNFRMFWDVLSLIAILNEAIIVPLGVFFEMEFPEEVLWITTAFFALDIAFNLFTGFFHEGILIMKQGPIIRQYILGWLPLDFISTFPWGAVVSGSGGSGDASILKFVKAGKVARVLRLLRVAKLNMLAQRIEDLFCGSILAISISLLKVIVLLALLCHWCACIWGWLGHPERMDGVEVNSPYPAEICEPGGPCEASINGSPWRRRYGLDGIGLPDQYIIALRFATGLFTGSDMEIQPGFWAERMFVVAASFVSFILCSTIMSQIIVTFHKIHQDQSDQHDLLRNFKEFMILGKVPFPLQAKIKRYLEFQFKSRKDLQMRQFDLMERLSPWLRKELQVHLNKKVLVLHSLFKGMPKNVLAHICSLAEPVVCAPGDIVLERGQSAEKMYFLVSGRLHVRFNDEAKAGDDSDDEADEDDPGVLLNPPAFIGALNLFNSDVRNYTVTSVAHSEVLTVTRSDIVGVIREFPAMQSYVEKMAETAKSGNPDFEDCSLEWRS